MNIKKSLFFLLFLSLSYQLTAQVVTISDSVFEQLLMDMEIDSDGMLNGQISTEDAETVTSLTIAPTDTSEYITNVTGIEAFVNLEELIIHNTMIEELNVGAMANLIYLDCADNMLSTLDLSGNPLLKYLNITSGGDMEPFNSFTQIDLSNNPNIRELYALGGITYINLKNGNNNPDMFINIGANFTMDPGPEYIPVHTCIEIDDAQAVQNNQAPYNQWTIYHSYQTYSMVESCSLDTEIFVTDRFSLYPNPATDLINISFQNGNIVDSVAFYDLSGRLISNYQNLASATIPLGHLTKGVYLVTISSGNFIHTEKLVIN